MSDVSRILDLMSSLQDEIAVLAKENDTLKEDNKGFLEKNFLPF